MRKSTGRHDMLKKLVSLTCLILIAGTVSSRAFAAPQANLVFVMPTGVDPIDLTFSFNGQSLFFTGFETMPDPQNPGDPFGVEFRSSGPLLFNRFVITKDEPGSFTGSLAITTLAENINGPHTPWGSTETDGINTLFAVPGSALVGDPNIPLPLHSILQFQSISNGTTGDEADYAGQRYKVTAFAVPEPGTWTMGGCLALLAFGATRLKSKRR